MLLLENDQLKQQDKDRFVRAAIALKANAEDPDADETDPVHLNAIALVTRINQVSPKILGGESEAIGITKRIPERTDKSDISHCEMLQKVEEWEQALIPLPAPIVTVEVSTLETPAPQRIEPTVLSQSETQSTASVNPKIARIMDAVRLKAKSTPQTAVPESESVSTSPAPLDLSLSPEQMASNRDRLARLMENLDKSSQIQKPLSAKEQHESEMASLNSDLEWIERSISQADDAGEIARLRDQREKVRDRKKAIEREKALAREQLQREQEEAFSKRKAKMLQEFYRQQDPFGGLGW